MQRYGVAIICLSIIAGLLGSSRPSDSRAQNDTVPLRATVADLETRVAALETEVAVIRDSELPTPSGSASEPSTPVTAAGLNITLLAAERRAGPHTLTVLVAQEDGSPVADATVTVMVRMPAMDHGVSGYPAVPAEPGRYTAAEVSLGMAGEWLVEVQVVRAGRSPAIAHFLLTLAAR